MAKISEVKSALALDLDRATQVLIASRQSTGEKGSSQAFHQGKTYDALINDYNLPKPLFRTSAILTIIAFVTSQARIPVMILTWSDWKNSFVFWLLSFTSLCDLTIHIITRPQQSAGLSTWQLDYNQDYLIPRFYMFVLHVAGFAASWACYKSGCPVIIAPSGEMCFAPVERSATVFYLSLTTL